MSKIRIIPSLLIKNNRLVKGIQFQNHKDAGDPVSTCVALESQLADEICIIDLDAYEKKIKPNITLLEKIISKISTPITFGGNISCIDDVKKIINNGADKVLINYDKYSDQLIDEIADLFGRQSITIAIDLIKKENEWNIYKNGKIVSSNISEYINKISKKRIAEIKVTFVSNEGMKVGFEGEIIKKIKTENKIPIIFEGGLGSLDHIDQAINFGAEGIALGGMIIFMDNNIFKIKQFLKNAKKNVRI